MNEHLESKIFKSAVPKYDTDKVPSNYIFNGRTYTRYLKGDTFNYEHRKKIKNKVVERRFLHRDIYEFYNGEIPEGYLVHHVDGNHFNNNIENLSLLTATEHALHHHKGVNRFGNKTAAYGHYAKKAIPKTCVECGKSYEAHWKNQEYCSVECRKKYAVKRTREWKKNNAEKINAQRGKERNKTLKAIRFERGLF